MAKRVVPNVKQLALPLDYAGRSRRVAADGVGVGSRRRRIQAVCGVVAVWSVVLVSRLLSLQVLDVDRWQEWAFKQHLTSVELSGERGQILDRNGRPLALSVPAGSVYVRPAQVRDRAATARALAQILSIDRKVIEATLAEKKPFVWIARQQPRTLADRVQALNLPGVGYVLETKRSYPFSGSASTLIGRVGVDGIGLSGLEATYNTMLQGEELTALLRKDALGNTISLAREELSLPRGNSMQLTIDATLQMIVDEELERGRQAARAKRGLAVLVDAETGDILSLSQAPTVNLNQGKIDGKDALKNYVIETVFEPGSILKPLVVAAAIEEGVATPSEMIDCEGGKLQIGRHLINDVHPNDRISFRDVLVRSSNIGMTKVGMRLGEQRLYSYLRRFGLGATVDLGLPGETAGILRPVSSWSKVDVATHSFGQGVAVTPLQMVRSMSALANGGVLPTLRLLSDDERRGERIVSERTSEKVREMLYAVVEDEHGTGGKAAVEGVRVGGKTGTAQKARENGRGYESGAYVASFVGFVDGRSVGVNKTLALIVMIDEPNTNTIYGGTLAAPVFSRVMQRTLHTLATQEMLRDAPPPAFDQSVRVTNASYRM